MIVHPLSIVMFSARNYIAHITTLYRVIAIIRHKLIGFVQMTFIIAYRSRRLMMHHQPDPFTVCIGIQHLHVKVGIGSHKVEHKIARTSTPAFPSFIPAFYQYLVETMFGGKIYIAFHSFISGSMPTVRLDFRIVVFSKTHSNQFICITPRLLTGNHLPPYAYILHRFNPRNIFIGTRFVQVQGKFGGKHITSVIAHHDGTPRGLPGSLHICLVSQNIRGQPRFKNQVLFIQIEMHTRIVHQSRFMQVDV